MKRSCLVLLLASCFVLTGFMPAGFIQPAEAGDKTIKIGNITALTGTNAVYGVEIVKGSELAAEMLNKAGGVEGYKIVIVPEDHATSAAKANSAAQKLIDIDHVDVLQVSFSSPVLAVQPLAAERQITLLNATAVGGELMNKKALYNSITNASTLYPTLVESAVKKHGVKRVATIFWNDAAGNTINSVIGKTCEKLGVAVVAAEPHALGATNYSAQLARIKASKPDLLVVGSYGNDLGYIIKQAKNIGLTVPIVGNDYTKNAAEIAGDALNGYSYIHESWNPTSSSPQVKEFVAAFEKDMGRLPSYAGANHYEAVAFVVPNMIKQAIKDGKDPTQKGVLLAAMEKLAKQGDKFKSLYGESMTIGTDGSVKKPIALYTVEGGKPVRVAEVTPE